MGVWAAQSVKGLTFDFDFAQIKISGWGNPAQPGALSLSACSLTRSLKKQKHYGDINFHITLYIGVETLQIHFGDKVGSKTLKRGPRVEILGIKSPREKWKALRVVKPEKEGCYCWTRCPVFYGAVKCRKWFLLSCVNDKRQLDGGPTRLLNGPQPRADTAQEVCVTEELIWPAGQTRLHTWWDYWQNRSELSPAGLSPKAHARLKPGSTALPARVWVRVPTSTWGSGGKGPPP